MPRASRQTGYQPADLLVLAYLAITTILLLVSPRQVPGKGMLTLAHLAALVAVGSLRWVSRQGPWPVRVVRDLYPLALLPIAYDELDSLNRLIFGGYFDAWVAGFDQRIFGFQISQRLYELLPYAGISEGVHLAYLAYGALIPLVALTLYLQGRREEFQRFSTTVLVAFAGCYLAFIVFPVLGPYHYFGPIDPAAKRSLVAVQLNRVLEHGSSPGTAFPSSHVAVALVVWIASRRLLPRLSLLLLGIATGIFVGTVYGGFHYGVDALAGLLAGIGLAWLGPRIHAHLLHLTASEAIRPGEPATPDLGRAQPPEPAIFEVTAGPGRDPWLPPAPRSPVAVAGDPIRTRGVAQRTSMREAP